MRATANFHLKNDSSAKLSFGACSRWISIEGKSPLSSEVTLFFPDAVPNEKLKAIEEAINDAMDAARAEAERCIDSLLVSLDKIPAKEIA